MIVKYYISFCLVFLGDRENWVFRDCFNGSLYIYVKYIIIIFGFVVIEK